MAEALTDGLTDVLVVGGGLAGLSCALALAERGMRVTVLERQPRLGGRAGSWADDATGDMVDVGPHVVHSEYRNMLALLERLGTQDLIAWQSRKVLTLASRPHPLTLRHWPLPAPLSLLPSMFRAPGLSARDYLSMTATAWRAMQFDERQLEPLDRLNALDFLRREGVSERMIDWWWRTVAMVVNNLPLERCSAAALLRIHAQLSGHHKLHFGFAAVGLAELYAAQAAGRIRAAGGSVRSATGVGGFIGRERCEGVLLDDGSTLRARYCVGAVPPRQLAALLPAGWRDQPPFDALAAFEPCPYISCYLWFDRPLRGERFISHLWSPERLNYDFYDLSQIRHGWSGRPSILASNIIYSHRAHHLNDDEIVQATRREIAEFLPAARQAHLRHARVHRIPMAIPCATPGMERLRPPPRTPVAGLFLAGDWIRTHLPYSMESAVASGLLAAEQVLADAGRPQSLALPTRPYDGLARVVHGASRWWRRFH